MATPQVDTQASLSSSASYVPVPSRVLSHRHAFERMIASIEMVADFLTVLISSLLCAWGYEALHVGKRIHYDSGHLLFAGIAFAFLTVLLLDHEGAYKAANSLLTIRETERVLRVAATAVCIVVLTAILSAHLVSRLALVSAGAMVPVVLAVEKRLMERVIRALHKRGYGIQNVLIYGGGHTGQKLFSVVVRSPKLGLRPVAIVDDNPGLVGKNVREWGYRHRDGLQIQPGPITEELLRSLDVRIVLVGIPELTAERLNAIKAEAFAADAVMSVVPVLGDESGLESADYSDIDGILITSLSPLAPKRWYETSKRLIDFAVGALLIFLVAPAWALIAVLIMLDSKGPVFFRQTRVGRHGKHFTLLKFRSMRVDAPKYGFHPTTGHDPRITRVGRWLRRTSLDELPQLFNVLRGDMSLVGPRPEMPFIVDSYTNIQRLRLRVTPGITGLWQISSDRASLIHENLQYDLYYIRNRNTFMDFAILLHTAFFAMHGT